MKPRSSRLFISIGLMASVLAGIPASADSVSHEHARQLLQQGKIRPLQEIVAIVRAKLPGEILETELECEDDGLVYDFKILRPGGRIQEVEVDAASGRIIKIEDDD